jgi:hypothetical protein
MLSKALEWVSVSKGTPLLGSVEGCSFLMAFEIRRYIRRYVKMPSTQVSLSTGAPLRHLEGIRLRDFGREKDGISGLLS